MTRYTHKSLIDLPCEEVFAWHKRKGAFGRLTPISQKVEVLDQSDSIEDGARIKLKVTQGPFSQNLEFEHYDYIENEQFCDRQVKGPFVKWEHRHRFIPVNERQCEMVDEIDYELPWYLPLTESRLKQRMRNLFDFRHRRLQCDLQEHKGVQRMKILIAGSSGLIGSALKDFLTTGGHEITPLVRSEKDEGVLWDPAKQKVDLSQLEGYDVIINLAGENLADSRWNEAKKQKILKSRVNTTQLLAESIKNLTRPPKVFVNASAIGYYGHVPEGEVTESHFAGEGFLSEVCQKWEAATECLIGEDIRIVLLRTGVVLSPNGGALKAMLTPFKFGLGGVIGSGKQMMSWIDIEDHIRAVYFCINTDAIHGPINLTAPNPVSNREFTKALGKALNRPTVFPMPEFVAQTLFGEMADEMLLSGAKVMPEKLLKHGFAFQYPTIKDSLEHLLSS